MHLWLGCDSCFCDRADKMSFDGRAQYADDNMDNIRAAVNDPFGENTWWMEFDVSNQGILEVSSESTLQCFHLPIRIPSKASPHVMRLCRQ